MKTKSTTISIRVSTTTKKKLDAIAKSRKRSKSFLAAEAIENYISVEEQQLQQIEEGLADIEAGRTIPHEQVVAWLKSWGKRTEKPAPRVR